MDEGYLETNANLVSVVSTLPPFFFLLSPLLPYSSDLLCAQESFTVSTAAWTLHNSKEKRYLLSVYQHYKTDLHSLIVLVHYLRTVCCELKVFGKS